jgi:hypothetical protein
MPPALRSEQWGGGNSQGLPARRPYATPSGEAPTGNFAFRVLSERSITPTLLSAPNVTNAVRLSGAMKTPRGAGNEATLPMTLRDVTSAMPPLGALQNAYDSPAARIRGAIRIAVP